MSGVADVLRETLRQLGDRRRKLEPFVDELTELDIVERDLRKTAGKLAKRARPTPPTAPRVAEAAGANDGGTHRDRALAVLANYPAGLSAAKIAEEGGIPGGQVYPLLAGMAAGDAPIIVRVGRGFYRLATDIKGTVVDASLSDAEREELGDRAVA